MSGITLVNQVKSSKFLSSLLQPVANAFVNAADYCKLGEQGCSPDVAMNNTAAAAAECPRYDDALREETDIIREAINRLPTNEGHDRYYRMKCASQYSLSHTIATEEATLKPEDDIRYLTPIIDEVAAEYAEMGDFNTFQI
ncbi:Cytochrome b-c1 complex subunit 7 [Haplosporangium sp. Z 767]|nr:Cytochrome b-c1 complex subunit 7 [Haplosporangium sp. Z 767]